MAGQKRIPYYLFINPNRLAVRAIHACKRAVIRCSEKNITIADQRRSLASDVYFWDCLQVILTYEQITLDEFCMLVVQHRQNSSLSSAVRLVTVIYFSTLANVRLEDDEVFASDMTDVGLQFHEPDAAPAPVTILPLV